MNSQRAKDKTINFPNSSITAFAYMYKRRNDYYVNLDYLYFQKISLFRTKEEANFLYYLMDVDTCESIDQEQMQDLHLQGAFKAFSMCMN